jgi:Xaa-Pro aminopeptidase
MPWTKKQIEYHKEAARRLDKIISEAFLYIAKSKKTKRRPLLARPAGGILPPKGDVSEYEVAEFMKKRIKEEGMTIHDDQVIVAFGGNTRYVHYFPSQYCRRIKNGELVMIDAWAALKKPGAPYADITRMGIYQAGTSKKPVCRQGRESGTRERYYDLLISAQDKVLDFLRQRLRGKNLPTGQEVDQVAREFLAEKMNLPGDKINSVFRHTLGHSLGLGGPHGRQKGFRTRNPKPIVPGLGYTIEPGLYFKNKFGLRSEIDVFIDMEYNLQVTTTRYKKLELI